MHYRLILLTIICTENCSDFFLTNKIPIFSKSEDQIFTQCTSDRNKKKCLIFLYQESYYPSMPQEDLKDLRLAIMSGRKENPVFYSKNYCIICKQIWKLNVISYKNVIITLFKLYTTVFWRKMSLIHLVL